VTDALDVLDGTKPSLAAEGSAASPLTGTVPPGTALVFRAIGVAEAKLPKAHDIAKQIDSLAFCLGENQGECFFEGQAHGKDDRGRRTRENGHRGATRAGALGQSRRRRRREADRRAQGDGLRQ